MAPAILQRCWIASPTSAGAARSTSTSSSATHARWSSSSGRSTAICSPRLAAGAGNDLAQFIRSRPLLHVRQGEDLYQCWSIFAAQSGLEDMAVDRGIVLDTTRMRVVGTGHANFQAEKIWLRLRPRSKTAQFFSLATPVQVTGTFSDFDVGVSPGDVAETVGRLATSVLWVPLQKLFGEKIPENGADVCQAPFEDLG